MSGHHPWNTLLERTFTPEERATIAAEGAKIADDNRRRRNPRVSRNSRSGRCLVHPGPPQAAPADTLSAERPQPLLEHVRDTPRYRQTASNPASPERSPIQR